jgi:hypothetical protein
MISGVLSVCALVLVSGCTETYEVVAPSCHMKPQWPGGQGEVTFCSFWPKGGGTTPVADSSPSLNREEVTKLLSIFESRLSVLLLQSIKLLSSTKKKTR